MPIVLIEIRADVDALADALDEPDSRGLVDMRVDGEEDPVEV